MDLNTMQTKKEKKEITVEIIYLVAQVLIISQLIMTYILYIGYVPTGSMIPTIPVGDKIIVWRLSSQLDRESKAIKHGNLVVFDMEVPDHYGGEPETTQMVKRVIALGGDTVEIEAGKVKVNDIELEEGYVEYQNVFYMEKIKVPEREMFLLGDNRANSYDSRLWEKPTISIDRVRGKILFKIPGIKNKINK